MHVSVYRYSIDTGSNSLIGYSTEFWEDGGGYNGPQCQVNVPDQYLSTNHVVLIRLLGWRNSTTFSIPLETSLAYTYFNLSRADIGGGSGAGGSGGSTGVSSTSGSGSYASISTISDNLSFSYNFPDALLVPLTRGNSYQERIFPFVGVTNANATSLSGIWNGDEIFSYELSMGSERFILIFNNDTSGTLNTYTEVGDTSSTDIIWSEMSPATTNQPTLKEFIDADRAIYYK